MGLRAGFLGRTTHYILFLAAPDISSFSGQVYTYFQFLDLPYFYSQAVLVKDVIYSNMTVYKIFKYSYSAVKAFHVKILFQD